MAQARFHCALCDEQDVVDFREHLRLFHPDTFAELEQWTECPMCNGSFDQVTERCATCGWHV